MSTQTKADGGQDADRDVARARLHLNLGAARGVCVSLVGLCVVCVCLLCVCLCVVLTLWPVRRLVNLADATAQPQLQPKSRCACLAAAASVLPSASPLSLILLSPSLSLCRHRASPHGILQFLWDFEIAFSTFAALSRTSRQLFICLPLPPAPAAIEL